MRAARVLAGVPGKWDAVCALGLLLIFAALLPLAYSGVPDPLWIHGIYDAGDADDAVLLAASMESLAPTNQFVIGPPLRVPCVPLTTEPALPATSLRSTPARAPPKP